MLTKTDTCGQLRASDAGRDVVLMGWVHRRRTHGGIVFVDMRDNFGLVQLVFNPELSREAHAVGQSTRVEYVIAVVGKVALRPPGTENSQLPTGEVEVLVSQAEVLNAAKTPPFYINEDVEVDEFLRLRYRYLDLRRESMHANILLRASVTRIIRDWLYNQGFSEIDTPILVNETPGGAREFLVPSRLHPGEFYALPQSPQQYKQLLMVAGFERYFQIARCFRDEDLRADRQPEFTQLDVEMSFVDQEQILAIVEKMLIHIIANATTKTIQTQPFPRMTYEDAMKYYGTDKPDIRFGLLLADISDVVAGSDFKVFSTALLSGGQVKGLRLPGGASYTRREIDDLTGFAVRRGAKGLVTMALQGDGIKSPLTKFLGEDKLQEIIAGLEGQEGDLLVFVADTPPVVADTLSELRLEIGRRLNLMDPNVLALLWIVDAPLLEWNAEEGHWQAKHHQFTSPVEEDIPLLDTDPAVVRAKQYDVVCNGTELGGGSVRIHRRALQEKIFSVLGMSEEQTNRLFGHLLEAFEFGTPPHGGIALGLDRFVMLLAGQDTIRDVIPFPKTQSATCPMTGSPSIPQTARLRELHIQILD
ncbi:MAG: aspartate--tRNA ligase [Chloroflexi bacterium]|nr:aspartate--tRNA ligase [Chloroflexota bacterium]